jgi:phosphatidylserine/phosphatidylglycerophosphate/cardiolipin synthase-like enzyme
MMPARNTARSEVDRGIGPCRAVEKRVRGYISKRGQAGSRSEVYMKPKSSTFAVSVLLVSISALIVGESLSKTPTTAVAPATEPMLATTQPGVSIEPHFSPEEEIAPTIVKLIDGSQHSLDIAAFAFTHPDIANAVIRAHQRGVKVQMVMDMVSERERNSLAPEPIKAGIPLRVRHKRGFQHSKYLIIDQLIIVTGSFNFTISADERNSENIVVIRNAPNTETQFSDDYRLLVNDSVIE